MPRDNNVPAHWNRELNMTEPEESVLVEMASYFLEMGMDKRRDRETL